MQKRLANRRALKVTVLRPNIVRPRPQRPQGCFTCLLDFRDSYYTRSRLLDHLDSNGFDYRSDRLLHFPGGFLHWRGFGLGPGNGSLCRFSFRGLRHLTCLGACSRLSSWQFRSLLYSFHSARVWTPAPLDQFPVRLKCLIRFRRDAATSRAAANREICHGYV